MKCAVCYGAIEGEPAGWIGLAGYTFTLPQCEACAGSARLDDAKELAVREHAKAHPESKGYGAELGKRNYRTQTFVITPESEEGAN